MKQPEIELSKLDHNGNITESNQEPVTSMVWSTGRLIMVSIATHMLYYNPAAEEFVNVGGTVTGKLCGLAKLAEIAKEKCCGRCIKGLDECIYGDL